MSEWWGVEILRVDPRPWATPLRTSIGSVKAVWTSRTKAEDYIGRMLLEEKARPLSVERVFIGVAKPTDLATTDFNLSYYFPTRV